MVMVHPEGCLGNEYVDFEGLEGDERLYLQGVVTALRYGSSGSSAMSYIFDYRSGRVVWLSEKCVSLLVRHGLPLDLEGVSALYEPRGLVEVEKAEASAFSFLLAEYGDRLYDFSCKSDVCLSLWEGTICYERVVSVLSLEGGKIRLLLCKLLPSSRYEGGGTKIWQYSTKSYYRPSVGVYYWKRKRAGVLLSEREQRILVFSGQGRTESEIASLLHLSCSRLKAIKAEMMRKLKVKNINHALRRAYSYGLIMEPEEASS